jgi:hypothetical protein
MYTCLIPAGFPDWPGEPLPGKLVGGGCGALASDPVVLISSGDPWNISFVSLSEAPYVAVEGRSMILGAIALAAYSFIVCQLLMRFSLVGANRDRGSDHCLAWHRHRP